METKFTKGKWEISKAYGTITDEKGFGIAQIHGVRNERDWNANAKLIASAPEMFEMLKELLYKISEEYIEDKDNIEQLLTKITE